MTDLSPMPFGKAHLGKRGFFASMFGAGALSVNMKKSAAFDFERFAESGMVLA